jgi:capsular exopolysaccharide synthesis family protein
MSRIQDILAKAERDGTARATHAAVVEPAPAVVARIPIPLSEHAVDPIAQRRPAVAALAPSPLADTQPGLRTARATLHHTLVSAIAPHSTAAERFRGLRARVAQREEMTPLRVIAITSPGVAEGKSVTATNLALAMAQEYQRTVLLVDADLRTPSIHSLLGIESGPGLSDVLTGTATLDQALVALPELGLAVLTAGAIPEYPSELLGSSAMRRTLDALRTRFDRVVLDLPGVTPVSDVGTVAPMVDGAVVVVRVGRTARPELDRALAAFDEQKVLGIVLNEAR